MAGQGDSADPGILPVHLDVKFTHLFAEKINGTIAGWFQNSSYETSDRNDDRWLAYAAADYLANDFFTLGIEGGIEERESNEAGKDFDNAYVLVKAKFDYDMGSK